MARRIPRTTTISMTKDGHVVVRHRGGYDLDRAFLEACESGLIELGQELTNDARRTAEAGVLLSQGYRPGPRGIRMGTPTGARGRPARYWPIWTGMSRQGFRPKVDMRRRVLNIFNVAVSWSGYNYPRRVEQMRAPLTRLFADRRRRYELVFRRAWIKSMRRRR